VNASSESSTLTVQNDLANAWFKLFPEYPKGRVHRLPSIEHAVQLIGSQNGSAETHILVAGSLHLVGGMIEAASLSEVVFQ
jgi:folylpolyglutamate synthase